MRQPILVIGGTGTLGGALVRLLDERGLAFTAPGRAELDVTDATAVDAAVRGTGPRAVINASGWSDVGRAEDSKLRDAVFALNRDAPAGLARVCAAAGAFFLHVSTDYVFDGRAERPYREEDPTNPLQVYGESKLAGEQAVRRESADALIVRVSTLYGPAPRRARQHYVDAILRQARRKPRLEVVRLPISSPTYAPDLAAALLSLLETAAGGLLHYANDGQCSRLELARATVEAAGLKEQVEVVERAAPPGDLARPDYSVLDLSRFAERTGTRPRPWRDALVEYVRGGLAPGGSRALS